jgi:hypothetical protein
VLCSCGQYGHLKRVDPARASFVIEFLHMTWPHVSNIGGLSCASLRGAIDNEDPR